MPRVVWKKRGGEKDLPRSSGVYLFGSSGGVLYIGKAVNIRERVKNHLQRPTFKDAIFINQASKIGCITTDSEIEALLLESRLIKKYQPKYNVMWKDDKKYFYVAITPSTSLRERNEKLPRVYITHQPKPVSSILYPVSRKPIKIQNTKYKIQDTRYIGPFVDGRALKKTLRFLRRIFPYYTTPKHPLLPCPWCHLELCPGPNPDPKEYRKNIKSILLVLRGKKVSVLNRLRREMKSLAKKQDFEKAAKTRDRLLALEIIFSHGRALGWNESEVREEYNRWSKIQNKLHKILGTKRKPGRIEACDISNIQGQKATGSIVTFINGKPDKNLYRRFKIKISGSPNDTAMIQETIARRLGHKEWGMPDVILIDGGIAQLNSALRAKGKIKNIKIISLAKKENRLYIEGREKPLLLRNCPQEVSNIILFLRDEAHRFAKSYHHYLRSRDINP